MIDQNQKLQAALEDALELALEIQDETGTQNLEVDNLRRSIDAVKARITFLKRKAEAATPKSKLKLDKNTTSKSPEQKQAEARAAAHEEYKNILRAEYKDGSPEQLEQVKAQANDLLKANANDDEAKCTVEVCDELLAAKQKAQV